MSPSTGSELFSKRNAFHPEISGHPRSYDINKETPLKNTITL
jgi:hypothetical protein